MPEIVITGYRRIEGLTHPDVEVVECFGDKVFFGTNGGGLCLYDRIGDAWYVIDETDGLSDNTVTAVVHLEGQVWVGTPNALNVYAERTKEWTYYTRKDGLPSDYITALAFAQGNVYVGTDKGLAIYSVGRGTWLPSSINRAVRCIAVDNYWPTEPVWVGTDKGISVLGKRNTQIYQFRSVLETYDNEVHIIRDASSVIYYCMIDEQVRDIAMDEERVWIAHNSGIMLYDRSIPPALPPFPQPWVDFVWSKVTREWGAPRWQGTDGLQGLLRQLVRDFAQEHVYCVEGIGKRVWIGTARGCDSGVCTPLWSAVAAFAALPKHSVKALDRDASGNLWIGTSGGAYTLNTESGSLTQLPQMITLASGYVRDVWINSRYAYAATLGGGLSIYDREGYQWSSLTKMDGLGSDFLTALAEHEGIVWIGSFGGGITRYDPQSREMCVYTRKQGLLSNTVYDIASFDGNVWFATPEGLSALDPKADRWYAYDRGQRVHAVPQPSPLFQLSEEKEAIVALHATEDRLWVVQEYALGFIEKGDMQYVHPFPVPKIGDARSLSCVVETNEAIWIGQGAQIKRWDKKAKKWSVHGEDKGLGRGQVRSLALCEGTLWAATYDGLCRYSPLIDRWVFLSEEDGLRIKEVEALSASGPVLLIGGRNGIAMYHTAQEWWRNAVSRDHLGVLWSNDVRDVARDSRYVWFATYGGGIARYDKGTQEWRAFTQADGLPSNLAVGLELQGGTVTAVFYDQQAARFDVDYGAWELVGGVDRPLLPYIQSAGELPGRPDGLRSYHIRKIVIDSPYKWCAAENGVWRYHLKHQIWKHYAARRHLGTDRIRTVTADEYDLWVGTAGAGIQRFKKLLRQWQQLDVGGSNVATAIVPDAFDLWVAGSSTMILISQEGGVLRRFRTADNFLGYEIRAILALPKENAIWVATSEGASFAPFSAYPNLLDHTAPEYWDRESRWTRSLEPQKEGTKWDTWSSVDRDRQIGRIAGWALGENLRRSVEDLFSTSSPWTNYASVPEIRKGYTTPDLEPVLAGREATGLLWLHSGVLGFDRIWVSTNNGLSQLTPSTGEWSQVEPMKGVPIYKIGREADRVYFGTSQGLHIYDQSRDRWHKVRASDGLADDAVLCIAPQGDEVWLGTSRGISVYHLNNGTIDTFTQEEGLASDYVSDIAVDGPFVWVAHHSNGLSRYDRIGKSWTVFRAADAVPHFDETR